MKLKILSVILVAAISVGWFTFRASENSKQVAWPEECDDAFAETYGVDSGDRIVVYELKDGSQLIQAACARGAYQGYFAYVLQKGKDSELLKFPLYETYAVSGSPSFNSEKDVLQISYREGGYDICRELRTYTFADGAPALVSQDQLCVEE